jgi:hypothetical protein
MEKKDRQIKRIKAIIAEYGCTTPSELGLSCSPCISSTGTNKSNISVLIEEFSLNYVKAITYLNETEIAEDKINYENLSDAIIDEIFGIMETYEKKDGQI